MGAWGIWSGQWLSACCAAGLIELSAILPYRWALTPPHYERLADLSSVGFVIFALYIFSASKLLGIYHILLEFPWVLLPLTIAQTFGVGQRIPRSAFLMALRRERSQSLAAVDLRPILASTCVLSASLAAPPRPYVAFILAILGIFLFSNRNPRFSPIQWFGCLVAATMLAGAFYLGIGGVQQGISDLIQSAFSDVDMSVTDPDRTASALGTVGRLKLSRKIRLRIDAGLSSPLPIRLTEARYQLFDNGVWRNRPQPLQLLDMGAGNTGWIINASLKPSRQMTLVAERTRELGTLALPAGTAVITQADVLQLQQHPLGSVLAETALGFVRYQLTYRLGAPLAAPPDQDDLQIPAAYRPLLHEIATQAGTPGTTPEVTLEHVERFFSQHFRYSLVQPSSYPGRLPLAVFLRRTRAGHCEYFAMATALLLREAGIPARYVVGYLVDEYSDREHAFIARGRDAHAWAEAYVGGGWRVIDTTPEGWHAAEAAGDPVWQELVDTLNWSRWQLRQLEKGEFGNTPQALLLLLPFLVAWLLWRLRPLRVAPHAQAADGSEQTAEFLEPLYTYIFRHQRLRPQPGETVLNFMDQHWPSRPSVPLRRLLRLYYIRRYSPRGLTPLEAQELNDLCVRVTSTRPKD